MHVKICVGLLLLSLGWMVVELLSSFGGEVVNDFASGTTLHELLDENDFSLLSQIVCKTSQITKPCLLLYSTIHAGCGFFCPDFTYLISSRLIFSPMYIRYEFFIIIPFSPLKSSICKQKMFKNMD